MGSVRKDVFSTGEGVRKAIFSIGKRGEKGPSLALGKGMRKVHLYHKEKSQEMPSLAPGKGPKKGHLHCRKRGESAFSTLNQSRLEAACLGGGIIVEMRRKVSLGAPGSRLWSIMQRSRKFDHNSITMFYTKDASVKASPWLMS